MSLYLLANDFIGSNIGLFHLTIIQEGWREITINHSKLLIARSLDGIATVVLICSNTNKNPSILQLITIDNEYTSYTYVWCGACMCACVCACVCVCVHVCVCVCHIVCMATKMRLFELCAICYI